jgi:hypothetical protein
VPRGQTHDVVADTERTHVAPEVAASLQVEELDPRRRGVRQQELADPAGENDGDTFGVSVASVGDVNGDGYDDFMVGEPGDDTGGTDAGRVSVFFGGNPLDGTADLTFLGDRPGRNLGRSLATAGHVDGPADLLAGVAEDPEQIGYDRGRVYVYANAFAPTGVPTAPASSRLAFIGPRPNPAAGDVNLVFELDHAVAVRVSVYDIAGHEVARPIANEPLVGAVTRTWRPRGLASGIYYAHARLGDREQVRKLVWLGDRRGAEAPQSSFTRRRATPPSGPCMRTQ